MNWANRQLGRLVGLLAAIGGVALAVLMAVTVVAVFWRYGLNDPIFGIEDISTMGLTVVVAAAVVFGSRHQAHVTVNVIRYFGGRKLTRYTDLVARLLAFTIVLIAAYALLLKGGCGLACGAITNNLSIVHTPFYYVLGLAFLVFSGQLALELIVGLANWRGMDPNEPRD